MCVCVCVCAHMCVCISTCVLHRGLFKALYSELVGPGREILTLSFLYFTKIPYFTKRNTNFFTPYPRYFIPMTSLNPQIHSRNYLFFAITVLQMRKLRHRGIKNIVQIKQLAWSMSLWLTEGKGRREGIVRELGIDMYTLLYLKWITNKDLLYSPGNCSVLCGSLDGRGVWGEWIHVIHGLAALLCT